MEERKKDYCLNNIMLMYEWWKGYNYNYWLQSQGGPLKSEGEKTHPLKMFAEIEKTTSPSKGLESLFPPGPHGFSDLPTVLLLYGENSL